jgi:hypothetical protein
VLSAGCAGISGQNILIEARADHPDQIGRAGSRDPGKIFTNDGEPADRPPVTRILFSSKYMTLIYAFQRPFPGPGVVNYMRKSIPIAAPLMAIR